MALQITGVVHDLLAPEANEFNGRTWATQTLVVDCGTMEPHLVAVEFDPDRDTNSSTARQGEQVVVNLYPISSLIKSGKMEGKYSTRLKIKQIMFPGRSAATVENATPAPQVKAVAPKNDPAPTPVEAAADAATSDDEPF